MARDPASKSTKRALGYPPGPSDWQRCQGGEPGVSFPYVSGLHHGSFFTSHS